MAKQGEAYYRYSYRELSAFCLQISLLLEAAVPLDEGLSIMAEDAADKKEKDMLQPILYRPSQRRSTALFPPPWWTGRATVWPSFFRAADLPANTVTTRRPSISAATAARVWASVPPMP